MEEAAKKHHPDRGGDAVLFQKLQSSYQCLSDPEKRAKYDAKVKRVKRKEALRSKGGEYSFRFYIFLVQSGRY